MKKILKLVKNNLVAFVIGAIIFSCVGIYAATNTTLLSSAVVTYDNTVSGSSETTVQGALTDLYGIANTLQESIGSCPNGYEKKVLSEYSYQCSSYQQPTITDQGTTGLSEQDIVTYTIGGRTENFRIAYIDDDIIKLFPEYNLTTTEPIQQSSSAPNVIFSSKNYWSETSYPKYIYNTKEEYCEANNLYSTIEVYKEILINAGIPVIEARLLTYDETSELEFSKKYPWSYNQTYWTGTAYSASGVYFVRIDGSSSNNLSTVSGHSGIRPLIIVPRDSIQI